MTERHRRKTRRELGCGCALLVTWPVWFILIVSTLLSFFSAIPHRLPLQESLDNVVTVELVNHWNRREEPQQLTLTGEQAAQMLETLDRMKSHHSTLGDPVFEYGRLQIHLTYENGDRDILSTGGCGQITEGQEDMDPWCWMDDKEMLLLFEEYFPELKGEATMVTGVDAVWQNIKRLIAAVLIFLTAWTALSMISIVRYSKTDERYWADAIIVLGAGTNGQEPNPVFRERLNHAVTLSDRQRPAAHEAGHGHGG